MFQEQDYAKLVHIAEMLGQMQDEEEVELLLMAI
jgi:Ca2+-binding EF-hand superfamily protein